MFRVYRFLLFVFLPALLFAEGIPYSVDFEGLDDSSILRTIKSTSQLVSLNKRYPASINALRYRAESDVPEMIKVLHAYGYYDATVSIRLEELTEEAQVIVAIDPGPIYILQDYTIRLYEGTIENAIECDRVNLEEIGIVLGTPALAKNILESEMDLLENLSICGYPLASIEKREILVDGQTKTLHVNLEIDTGPLARFGPVCICGQTDVCPELIERKIVWCQGERYNSCLVEKTQKALMDTGLFCSVLITHEDALQDNGELALQIEVTESKHRSVSIGVSYQTVFGPGVTFGWEHRNLGGMGRKLSVHGDITKRSHSGIANYLITDFRRIGQDFIAQAQAMHESITPYSLRSYNFISRVERKIGKRLRLSIGGKIDRLYITESAVNGNFVVAEAPIYVRWSTANDLLDPTAGTTFESITTPSINIGSAKHFYMLQEFSQSVYTKLSRRARILLAQKLTLGTILCESIKAIPLSKRFLGGSEEELRGYRYRTVSPLRHDHKPLGGRSAVYYTCELRFRVDENTGLVPFLDMGNVYSQMYPTFKGRWLKSAGLGYRYYSFMGPLRLDVAFPLDRRKRLDPRYKIFVSIGQTF